jgi:hypothetical protein
LQIANLESMEKTAETRSQNAIFREVLLHFANGKIAKSDFERPSEQVAWRKNATAGLLHLLARNPLRE